MRDYEAAAEWGFQNYIDHLEDLGYDMVGGTRDVAVMERREDERLTPSTDRGDGHEPAVA